MSIQEIFQRGVSFLEFVNQDKDTYKENTLELYEKIIVPEELLEDIQSIDRTINILVFAEIWCPDCMINVPVLQKMADMNDNFKISIVSREGNEAYLESYKVNGKPKIPTFILMNEGFDVLGAFVEQPQIVKIAEAKGNQVEIIVVKRKYRKGEYQLEAMKEILAIAKK